MKDNRSPRAGVQSINPKKQKKARSVLYKGGVLVPFNDSAAPLETMLVGSAFCLYDFFHENGYAIFRNEWESKKVHPALRSYVGWVYAFYGDDDFPIYIGETGRSLTRRFAEHMKTQDWCIGWRRVKVLPCPNQAMRKIFESLIGLAGGYHGNKAQPTGADNILDDTILSLLYLGNDNNRLPAFPNEGISTHLADVRSRIDDLSLNKRTD